jgi:hypothetical protein
MDALPCFKNTPILYDSRLECFEQLSQLCQLQIPNKTYVKNLGTNSIFENSMNFKGVQTVWGKSDKFSKIIS